MFSLKITKILAVVIPLLVAIGNCVPSNIFLSMSTVAAFFAFYVSANGDSTAHQSLRMTAIVAAACLVLLAPVVVFDNFYFHDDLTKSTVARMLKAMSDVTPYLVFFGSIGYAIFVAGRAAVALLTQQQGRNAR